MENIYSINSPNKLWRAEISARFGANVARLQYNGKDVLNPLTHEDQLKISYYIFGSPILLPANRTENGEFIFEGKKYFLPINEQKTNCHLHGLLVKASFNVVESSGNKVVLQYENKGEIYPFSFIFTAEYELSDDGLNKKYTVFNTDNKNMPFTFALHTTFVEPSEFSVPISAAQERDERALPTGKLLPLDNLENSFTSGCNPNGKVISGYYKSCGNTAKIGDFKYIASDNFDYWVLFNNGGTKGYLCVEPQSGSVNGLNMIDGHKVLAPKQEMIFTAKITK